jgi:hypothetical protein
MFQKEVWASLGRAEKYRLYPIHLEKKKTYENLNIYQKFCYFIKKNVFLISSSQLKKWVCFGSVLAAGYCYGIAKLPPPRH